MIRFNGQFQLNNVNCGDKSLSHRALIIASVAQGISVIDNLSLCADVMSTVECLTALGASITIEKKRATVIPFTSPNGGVVLNCGNSATTARLLAGLVSGLGCGATFVGDESLMNRPMERVLDPLRKMGAHFTKPRGTLFKCESFRLTGCNIQAEVTSAQVKSAVILAGLFADGETSYTEKFVTRDHTERMLQSVGADVDTNGRTTVIRKTKRLKPLNITIPNDPSSVAVCAMLALLTDKEFTFKKVLVNDRRTGFFRVIEHGGANIKIENVQNVFGEEVGDITVKKGALKTVNASYGDVCDGIDEVVALACLAVATKGTHLFVNVKELRVKECDRVEAIKHIAEVCGQEAFFDGSNLQIKSNGILPKNPRFRSFSDHRVAMCESALCIALGGGSVDDVPCEVSFPEFFKAIGVRPLKLGLIGSEVSKSKSPFLMDYLASHKNICCRYDLLSLGDASDEELLRIIGRYDGLNVTMPYKRRVSQLLSSETPSVNTVGKNVKAQSTDGYGIVKALQNNRVDFENKPLWIVGAGGAAEECVITLLRYGCKIRIINRTAKNAEVLTSKYNLRKDITEPYGVLSFVPECEFEQALILPKSVKFVFAAAYKGQSGLRNQAQDGNIKYVGGLEMLYHQGAKSFSLWTNTDVQDDYDGFIRYLESVTNR